MAYAYILVCYVIPRASPSELHKHPWMYTYAIHHDNPCYNIYMILIPVALTIHVHVFGANFHLVQNRLKVDVTPISINSVNKLVG